MSPGGDFGLPPQAVKKSARRAPTHHSNCERSELSSFPLHAGKDMDELAEARKFDFSRDFMLIYY